MFAVQEQLVESQQEHHQMEEELNKVRQVSPTCLSFVFCAANTVSIDQPFRSVGSIRWEIKQLRHTHTIHQTGHVTMVVV